jgi:parvulin-like peptidyl-prolyl isomerase
MPMTIRVPFANRPGWDLHGAILLAPLLITTACREPHTLEATLPLTPDQLARVGSNIISVESFLAPSGQAGTTDENQARLNHILRHELLFAEAQRIGFDQSPAVRAAFKNLVVQRFEESLEHPADEQSPSDSELAAYHASHPERYTTPEKIHAALIQLRLPPSASADRRSQRRQEAESIRAAILGQPADDTSAGRPIEIQKGSARVAPFAELARTRSEHPGTRSVGGDLGWLTRSRAAQFLPREVVDCLFQLSNPGDLSPVLETVEGVFLVQRIDRQAPRLSPLEEVRERVRRDFTQTRASASEANRLADLRRLHPVEVNEARLSELARPEPTLARLPARTPNR